ncbi:hypothetical protein BDV93DRAFT_511887 [Ceratobasidium sp. AG-I]|nr:hypothetical protein BDV93DRAFT_511887 [Ceratobasidium sp. AG-I]
MYFTRADSYFYFCHYLAVLSHTSLLPSSRLHKDTTLGGMCRGWSYSTSTGALFKAPKFNTAPSFNPGENTLFRIRTHVTSARITRIPPGQVTFEDHFGYLGIANLIQRNASTHIVGKKFAFKMDSCHDEVRHRTSVGADDGKMATKLVTGDSIRTRLGAEMAW